MRKDRGNYQTNGKLKVVDFCRSRYRKLNKLTIPFIHYAYKWDGYHAHSVIDSL